MQMDDHDELLIHDDGSNDGTWELLNNFSKKDSRIRLLICPPTGGPKENFSFLLQQTSARYIYCADQDDIWMPNKLDLLQETMRFYEKMYGEDTPLLVHSNLKLIDTYEKPIADSLWSYQGIDPRWGDHLNLLLTQNVVTGCAMMINRPLLQMALPIPEEAVMHDWWLALVACAFGRVIWTPETTVLYRQHSGNSIGAKRFMVDPKMYFSYREDIKRSMGKSTVQAGAFAHRYGNSPRADLARLYSELPNLPYLARRYSLTRHKFFKSGRLKNLAWITFS